MKSRHQTIVASALLAAIFAIPSIYFVQKNSGLEHALKSLDSKSLLTTSKRKPTSTRSAAKLQITVGQLIQQGPDVKNAGALLRTYFADQET